MLMVVTRCNGIKPRRGEANVHAAPAWRPAWLVSVWLSLVAPVPSAFAASPSADSGPGLTEQEFLADVPMVLTVSRLAQPIEEAPAPVTVIDREMIKASGFRDLAQLFRLVPGFITVAQRGGFPAVLYGVDDDFARRMQVLVDGRSIYTPSFGGVEWGNLPLEIEDIERIEVIRGPNAATYGANSFFGVINVVTRHAAQDPGALVSVTKGDHQVEHGVARYSATAGRLSYRLTAGYHQDGGFVTLHDTLRVKRVSMRADYQISNSDSFQFQAGHNQGTDATGRAGQLFDPQRELDIDSHFAQMRWQRALSADSELMLQYYHTRYRTTDEFAVALASPAVTLPVDFNSSATRDNLELQHTLKPLEQLRVVWGMEARSDKVRAPRYFNKPSVKNDLRRVYGNAEWRATPDVLVNLGAMWEDNDITAADVSPRVALNYRLRQGHTVRVSVSRATRTPVLLEQQADEVFQVGPIVDRVLFSSGGLRSERIQAIELGYLGQWLENRLAVDARVHRDEVEDLIMQTRRIALPPSLDNVDGARDFINAGDLTLTGFETQVKFTPGPGLRLIGNYSYLQLRAEDFNGGDGLRLSDFAALSEAMPKHNFGLLAIARFNEQLQGSLGYYRLSGAQWAGGDPLPHTTKLDLRLAYGFKFGANRGEWQFVAQDIYSDYLELERNNRRDMRFYLNLGFQF